MSFIKRQMEEDIEKGSVAEDVCLEVGVLERCEICGVITDTQGVDMENAYKKANHMISKSHPLVEVFNGNRKALTDLIKETPNSYGCECRCDKED